MSISLFEQSQIRNYYSPTGNYTSTGWGISGNVQFFNTITGNSGNFVNLSCQTLDISGAIRSSYLSGILGNAVTGSGIVHFLSTIDTSGNNVHFLLSIHTGNRNAPLYSASSSNNQNGWFFYDDSFTWQNFPALGLSSTQQDSSIVRHVFSPTGLTIYNQLFAEVRPLFAGNVTGGYVNSYEFIPNSNGFSIGLLSNFESIFSNADSRFARKLQTGNSFILSGVKVSGIPITVPNLSSVPSSGDGIGSLIQVSGKIYNWNETIGFTGYQLVCNITGLTVPTGGVVSAPLISFVGNGSVGTSISGNAIIISGASSNQIGIAEQTFGQGNFIFSGQGGLSITSGTTASGTLFVFSGGAGGAGGTSLSGIQTKTGSTILTNSSLTNVPLISGAGRNSVIRIGNPQAIANGPFSFSLMDISDVFLFGNGTNRQRIYGPWVWSGAFFEKITSQTFTAYDPFTDSIDDTNNVTILKFHPLVTGISINNSGVLTSGGFIFSGAGGTTVSAASLPGNQTQIIITSTSSGGGSSSIGGVTGFATDLLNPLFTGGFIVTGAGGITTTLTNLGNNISGILVSGTSSSSSLSDFDSDQILLQLFNTLGY